MKVAIPYECKAARNIDRSYAFCTQPAFHVRFKVSYDVAVDNVLVFSERSSKVEDIKADWCWPSTGVGLN